MKWLHKLVIITGLTLAVTGCAGRGQEAEEEKDEIPTIPHEVTAKQDCASCHKEGTGGAPVTNHISRGNCTECHKVEKETDEK